MENNKEDLRSRQQLHIREGGVCFVFPIEIISIFLVFMNGEVDCQQLAVQKAD